MSNSNSKSLEAISEQDLDHASEWIKYWNDIFADNPRARPHLWDSQSEDCLTHGRSA